jgi:hypothetical protein
VEGKESLGGERVFHYFSFSIVESFFARAFDNTDRKTFIIFRSLFLSIVHKSFSLFGRFSLPPTNPLKSLFSTDDEADVIAIVELSPFAKLLGISIVLVEFFFRKKLYRNIKY